MARGVKMDNVAIIEVKLPVCIEKTEHGYTAYCEALDVYTEAPNKKKAEKNIREALSLFLETCFEMGTLYEVLTSSGFKREIKRRKSAPTISCENIRVPLNPVGHENGSQAYAH